MDQIDEHKEKYKVLGEETNFNGDDSESEDPFVFEPEGSYEFFRDILREKVHRPPVSLDFIKAIKEKLDY